MEETSDPCAVHFGDEFNPPSKKVMRLNRAAKGPRMFEADELRRMLEAASQPITAMLLLGINCALGNADIANLPLSAIDLDDGWLTYARGKTGIERRAALWPETVQAIREWLPIRPAPKNPANFGLLFITKRGNAWDAGTDNRAITHECRKLLDALKIGGNRNFYALRHTFRTIADATCDFPAVRRVMGHADESIDDTYRERIDDERLVAVAEHVRAWLCANGKKNGQERPRLKIAGEGDLATESA